MGLQVGVKGKQYPERLTTSYVRESDTFGRDEDKKKVIDLLLSSDASGNEMCVIAIVGMGGIGKTTLAQQAYNDSRVEQHFNLKIWFCVSEEFVMPMVEKSIIEAATSSPCPKFENPEQFRVILKKNLTGKKFLLVLDDVWRAKPDHREFLGQLLEYGARGSKILVTTRNKSVASAMHAIPHHLELLPKDDCWSLFEKHAFRNGSSNADPKIKEIGTKIMEKCKGLPLAVKAIGDLLWSESNVERWTNILKSNLWDLPMEGTYILPALRLSYNYLPSYLKRCFAYCSIFPKDHIFEKDQLVLLWMAEGFLQPIETMEQVGNCYFDDLVSRSLFQQSLETNSGFVMHDLVNDLAKSVSGQFGTDSLKKIVKMTRYVHLCESWGTFQDIKEDLLKAKQLRTFLTLRFSSVRFWENKMPRTILCLRVLSLGRIEYSVNKLPDSIGEMKYLRYLDVSGPQLYRLPDSICNLCNLQTLKLSSCLMLDRLPRDMWKLINLRHLEIDQTYHLKEMPIKMGRLNCLQTLTKFIVSKHDSGSGSSIGELGKLINLRGKLLIEKIQNVRSVEDAFDASLKDKAYLEKLVLEWSPLEEVLGISESQRGVLENLQPHEKLKSLTIVYYGGKGFPDWIGGLTSLSELKLFDCKYCSALPPLGHLPFLNQLEIKGLHGVVNVGPEFYGNCSNSSMKPFGSLKFLRLKNLSNWENWFYFGVQNEVETFSQLEELYIENCPKLRGMLPVYLPLLDKLEILDCQHLKASLSIDSFPVLTRMKIIRSDNLEFLALAKQHKHDGLLSKLKILLIDDCKKCELPMHQQFSSLEVLFLKDCCDSLTSFPLDLFPNLKCIRIDGCRNLQSLEQRGGDLVISEIGIWRCFNFVSFPKGGLRAPNLVMFTLKNCESLRSMPCKMHLFLPSLRYLELVNCPEVESFPEEEFPSNLKKIIILTCKKLIANLWKEILPRIEWLEIGGDESEDHVESFPGELLLPTTLTYLHIKSFGNLKSLDKEGFQHLTSLVELQIYGCPFLMYMPEEGLPASLRFLSIKNCPVLKKKLRSKKGKEWLKVTRVPNIVIDDRLIQGYRWQDWTFRYEYDHDLKFEQLTNCSRSVKLI
ncbi:putative disease resistance RPP13-like protein 1 [Juglans regia]|uniref:Disease resistance RPP13-like protein 1 n=1 Tax=Juglans regia TaxID=51240 RepID=A0A6P9ESA0_JUGRE|nr:putative disease resistance RPP13-like protein 1 [Juglans regia]